MFLLACALILSSWAAGEVPPFVAVARDGEVYIYLTETPARGIGFNVYRAPAGTGRFVKLNPRPILGVFDPYAAMDSLGRSYEILAGAVGGESPFQTLRRVRRSNFTSTILSFLDPKVAEVLGRLYVDRTAGGRGYLYRITFVDPTGKEGPPSRPQEVRGPTRPPVPPGELKVEVGDMRVTLRWGYPPWRGDLSDLAFCFRVYRKDPGAGKFRRVDREVILRMEGTPPSYTDVWLENGKRYLYYVTAVDVTGRESPPSEVVEAVPEDRVPPAVPKGLSAMPLRGGVRLSWDMNLELDLSHYDVYRSTGLKGEFSRINPEHVPGDSPVYLDTTMREGRPYFYKVSATDFSGNVSRRSNAVSVLVEDATPPEPPTGLIWEPEGRGVIVRWRPSLAEDLRGYYVYRGRTRDIMTRLNGSPVGPDTTWFFDGGYGDAGLRPGGSYYFGVSAVDSSWNESPMALLELTMPDDEPPSPPSTLAVEVKDDGTVRLAWNPSPSSDVVKYRLYRRPVGGEPELLGELSRGVRSFADGGVEKGVRYVYAVTSVDRAGNEGPPRSSGEVVPRDSTPPSSPRQVRACATPEGVEITWGRVVDRDLAGFNVYRSDLPTGKFVRLNSEPVRGRRFMDKGGTRRHWYRVHAVDTSGNESLVRTSVRPRGCVKSLRRP
ncbi:MAG TPA: hypothetical protein EYP61_06830 [Candidatus Latescibacteria bacterium]|nr:hypothetical protein [Candidatus Latescibacterota bacterium]